MSPVTPIPVQLDPAQVDEMINSWKEIIDLKIPMKVEFKIHMMKRRRDILANYVHTGKQWGLLLSCITATGDPEQLNALKQRVNDFRTWAETEIAAIDGL